MNALRWPRRRARGSPMARTPSLAPPTARCAAPRPSSPPSPHASQAEHWLAYGQCDCIYYINTYAWDFPMVGALIAPRPRSILSGQKDTIFPPDGYPAVFQRAKKVYDL